MKRNLRDFLKVHWKTEISKFIDTIRGAEMCNNEFYRQYKSSDGNGKPHTVKLSGCLSYRLVFLYFTILIFSISTSLLRLLLLLPLLLLFPTVPRTFSKYKCWRLHLTEWCNFKLFNIPNNFPTRNCLWVLYSKSFLSFQKFIRKFTFVKGTLKTISPM